jgi:hypothetical protein
MAWASQAPDRATSPARVTASDPRRAGTWCRARIVAAASASDRSARSAPARNAVAPPRSASEISPSEARSTNTWRPSPAIWDAATGPAPVATRPRHRRRAACATGGRGQPYTPRSQIAPPSAIASPTSCRAVEEAVEEFSYCQQHDPKRMARSADSRTRPPILISLRPRSQSTRTIVVENLPISLGA